MNISLIKTVLIITTVIYAIVFAAIHFISKRHEPPKTPMDICCYNTKHGVFYGSVQQTCFEDDITAPKNKCYKDFFIHRE
jgi:hypothetical protein